MRYLSLIGLFLLSMPSFCQFNDAEVEITEEQKKNQLVGTWEHFSIGSKTILYQGRNTFVFKSDGTFDYKEYRYTEILGGQSYKSIGLSGSYNGKWEIAGSKIKLMFNGRTIYTDSYQIGVNGFGNYILVFNPSHSRSSQKRNSYLKK